MTMNDTEFTQLYNQLTPEAQSGVRMAVTLLAAANNKGDETTNEKPVPKND